MNLKRNSGRWLAGGLVASALLTTLIVAACGGNDDADRRVVGEEVLFYGAKVTTWATVDSSGTVKSVGVNVPYSSVQTAAAFTAQHPAAPDIFVASFPAGVSTQTFVDHFEFDWMPMGHGPGTRYMTEHFDFHFYGATPAQVAAIQCDTPADAVQIPPADVPDGWFPPLAPGEDPLGPDACVPNMGYHSPPATEFDLSGPAPVPLPGLFDKVMIAGSYGGKFTFIEPMIAKAQLDKKTSFNMPVPQPKNLGRSTRYPTSFKAVYDPQSNSYDLILGDFKPI